MSDEPVTYEITQEQMDKVWTMITSTASCIVVLGQISDAYGKMHVHEMEESLRTIAVSAQAGVEGVMEELFPEQHKRVEHLKNEILKRAQAGNN